MAAGMAVPTCESLAQAHDLYAQGCYTESAERFRAMLAHAENSELTPHLKTALAQALYQDAHYQTVCNTLTPPSSPDECRLLALAHAARGDSHQADQILSRYMETAQIQPEDLRRLTYLRGMVGIQLARLEGLPERQIEGENLIRAVLKDAPPDEFTVPALHTLATAAYQKGDFAEAALLYSRIAKQPESPYKPEALFFGSRALEKNQAPLAEIQALRKELYENYPHSPHAAEAYLTYYPYADYFNGQTAPIKHLEGMASRFPRSPYLVQAYYFIGLERVRKKNLAGAITAFHEGESAFDALPAQSVSSQPYFIALRYRCELERAKCNIAIANESRGTKQQIYQDYAIDVLKQIRSDFNNREHALTARLKQEEAYPALLAESELLLAQSLYKNGEPLQSDAILDDMISQYRQQAISRGYFLSRAWTEKGAHAYGRQDYLAAAEAYKQAEECAKGKLLSSDQQLDLWIQQSLCQQALQHYDEAMLILSKAINADLISGLRLKAMFLRAEIYEKQGRPELALKQLEALANKNGEWALKAKEKLNYGHPSP